MLAKLKEEFDELEAPLAAGATPNGAGGRTEEMGDLLFVVANLARHLKVDPGGRPALANAKFVRRFRASSAAWRRGKTPQQSDLAEMDRLWDEVKAEEARGFPDRQGPRRASARPLRAAPTSSCGPDR